MAASGNTLVNPPNPVSASSRRHLHAAGLVAVGLLLGLLLTSALGRPSAAAEPAATPLPAKTVYIDVAGLGKRNSAEKRINEIHAAMAAQGYVCVDLSVYTENGDLEGFFATYRKE